MKNSLILDIENVLKLKYLLIKLFVATFLGKIGLFTIILIVLSNVQIYSQGANPSNWLYPDGNLNATLFNAVPSNQQFIDSFSVKWTTPYISGDVKPLIGNLVRSNPLSGFIFEPNEIVAVMGDEIVMLSGTGSLLKRSSFPNFVTGIKSISCLIDPNSDGPDDFTNDTLIMALEGIEQFNPLSTDSLAYSYLFGYNRDRDSIIPLKRLALNLRPFNPNIFASIKPLYGKSISGRLMIYASVNMTLPKITDIFASEPPFFRGLAEFYDIDNLGEFPLPDLKDDINNRVIVGPEVNLGQPSIYSLGAGNGSILLPIYPTTKEIDPNFEFFQVSSLVNGSYIDTYADIPALVGINFEDVNYNTSFTPYEINLNFETRPLIKPYYLDIIDNGNGDQGFILVTEQYSGMDHSNGLSKLHIHDLSGNPLTEYDLTSDINPAFRGDTNHYWGVAVGDMDGNVPENEWLPYYPKNDGNEIIVTQSSRDFAYPGSRIFVMRYNSGPEIEKPTPNGEFLFPLDTICSQKINGWVAAVNDLDNNSDGKDEIILADGNKIMIIKMRDYTDYRFRLGFPFDTIYVKEFFNQQVMSVAVADLEGDERNDIIVTTDDSTYVIGSVIPNTLFVTKPDKSLPDTLEYCATDSVDITWINTIFSQDKVDLMFEHFNGIELDTLILSKNIPNNKDTINYTLSVDSLLAGKIGRFIVSGSSKPYLLSDYSSYIKFNLPKIIDSTITFNNSVFTPGDDIMINGDLICSDSTLLEIQIDSLNWQMIAVDTLAFTNRINLMAEIPCLENYFACSNSNSDTVANIRIIAMKGMFRDTLISSIVYKPIVFPIKIDTSDRADPTIYFNWNVNDLDSSIIGKDLLISVSADSGKTFTTILNTAIIDERAYWNVPISIPDTLMFRLCIDATCFRQDTMLYGLKPTYIDIIAPNPFNPDQESLQIVYQVPDDTRVTIRIVDQNNRIIADVINSQDRQKGIVYSDYWNGRRSDGASAAIGMYYVLLELSNGKKEIYPVYIRK